MVRHREVLETSLGSALDRVIATQPSHPLPAIIAELQHHLSGASRKFGSVPDPSSRIAALEAENAQLRSECAHLQQAVRARDGPAPPFTVLMRRLYDHVLEPFANGSVSRNTINAFCAALLDGCGASDEPAEQRAVRAFVHIINHLNAGSEQCSRDVWCDTQMPPTACTAAEAMRFCDIVAEILDSKEATRGLIATMEANKDA